MCAAVGTGTLAFDYEVSW